MKKKTNNKNNDHGLDKMEDGLLNGFMVLLSISTIPIAFVA